MLVADNSNCQICIVIHHWVNVLCLCLILLVIMTCHISFVAILHHSIYCTANASVTVNVLPNISAFDLMSNNHHPSSMCLSLLLYKSLKLVLVADSSNCQICIVIHHWVNVFGLCLILLVIIIITCHISFVAILHHSIYCTANASVTVNVLPNISAFDSMSSPFINVFVPTLIQEFWNWCWWPSSATVICLL